MTSLIRYEAAKAALAEARSVDEVKEIRDRAEAMRLYGRMAKDVQLELDAAEIRVRAERRLGLLIIAQKQSVGLNKGGRPSEKTGSVEEPVSPAKLSEAGIDKKLSSRSQKVASLKDEEFETLVGDLRSRMEEKQGRVSLDIVREHEKAEQREQFQARIEGGGTVDDLHRLAASGYKAGVILADPPWHFMTRSARGEGRSASQHYKTDRTGIEEIKALPVPQLAADDCVLLMWMVDWAPAAALEVIQAWGFEHKTTAFTWVKQNKSSYGMFMGQGYWTRANPEQCWLATRGSPKRLNADVRQLVIAKIDEHSRKPDEIYTRIEQLVGGPYLELYARRPRKNWTSWGNELPPPVHHDAETGEVIEQVPDATPASAMGASGDRNDAESGATGGESAAQNSELRCGESFEPLPPSAIDDRHIVKSAKLEIPAFLKRERTQS